tara:strand:- start:687 stop:3281 length:2595 start_codon:yes stop_codon:yes gene_type:complete
MAIKKIINNQPLYGEKSQYNFSDNETNFGYQNSISLPINYDKYTKKDLQTTVYNSEVNEVIIENNLKYEGETSIVINNIRVDNTGVNYRVKNIRVRAFLFSEKAFLSRSNNKMPLDASYNELNSILNGSDFTFYAKAFSNRRAKTGLGNIEDMQGVSIVSDFSGENLADSADLPVGDFPNYSTAFNPDTVSGSFQFEGTNPPGSDSPTKIIDDEDYNPLYVAFWLKGDAKRWWGTDRRKRKFQIYQIPNTELFDGNSTDGFVGKVYPIEFDNGSSNSTKTGGGGSGAAEAPAFKISSFKITFDTEGGGSNEGITEEPAVSTIPFVLPKSPFYLNDGQNNDLFLSLSPYQQLNNTDVVETNKEDIFADYFVLTTFGVLNLNNNQDNTDLQSYYGANSIESLKASSPSTVTFNIDLVDPQYNDTGIVITNAVSFVYFVIDWDDKDDKIKTIDDYLDTKPDNLIDLLNLQNDDLYKIYGRQVGGDDLSGTPQHSYTTPGIKTIKFITITFDEQTDQLGRWKLVKSRFYLDIPINQYPDFGEVGGSDYTTIPWPYTTPIIGGVDENSKYKTSVQETLSSGKIGNTDIIDEKFLTNDLDNDEMGKSITKFDLEQCRYFNKSYDMNKLLNISSEFVDDTVVNTEEDLLPINNYTNFAYDDPDSIDFYGQEYLESAEFLADLPFPKYMEEFDATGQGGVPDGYIDVNDVIYWTQKHRPDIGLLLNHLMNPTDETYDALQDGNYTYPDYVNSWSNINDIPSGVLEIIPSYNTNYNNFNYWNGETTETTFSEESSIGQIFITENQDLDLKQSCKLELNTGQLSGKSIYDSSGNSNKGLLIGDYKVKKVRKGEPMRRDSFIKVPKKTGNTRGAL